MADYTIRVYKNRDYNAVRMLFSEGMVEHIPATCAYLLKLPRGQFVLFISFITLLLISRSYLLSLVSLAIVFTAGRRLLTSEYHQYVDKCQREDLLDIEESYMIAGQKMMAGVLIRTYESTDYDDVRALFAEGMMDYVSSTSFYLLSLRQVHMVILVSFFTFYLFFRSFFVSLLVVVALLAGGRLAILFAFHRGIKKTYQTDLQNIEESYMLRKNACFWVAEVNGRVVGMVGVQPVEDSPHDVVLRRLSVAKDQRHKGIATSLCRHVIDFARQRGYKHVTLNTSTIQHGAHQLYLNMGFRKVRAKPVSSRMGRMANVTVTYYTYDVKSEPVSGKF
ncbi:probable N-acetyltransferase camello [Dendrobates tinctorius]|uniref:probable N-acetyltransferase camello n=1 Tax=Dendrobates tinctorius TaxID=92724 RepID=UPI003CC9D876